MDQLNTVPELVRLVRKSYTNPKALNEYENGTWKAISSEDYTKKVTNLASYLIAKGLKKGERVGILALPSPYWTIIDLAIICAGGISVPLFANISEENFIHEIEEPEIKIIFVGGGEEQWEKLRKHRDIFTTVIALDGSEKNVEKIEEAFKEGSRQDSKLVEDAMDKVQADDVCSIFYTSGSTGLPKGVELTNRNIVSLLHHDIFQWNQKNDTYLSILPLAHVLGHTLNYIMLAWSIPIYYFNDLKNIGQICRELKPTLLAVVPRLLEKIYAKIYAGAQEGSFLKKKIANCAIDLALQEHPNPFLHKIMDILVYKKLRAALGGRVRVAISGGSPLSLRLYHFYLNIGVPVYEGWGLTEACPVIVNRPGKIKVGTIGKPLRGQEVKISEEGEILIKGSLVMKGYYKKPDLTAKTLKDGWLHTGDKGTIDKDGYVKIIGRLKEMLKTSTGEMVIPSPIEQSINKSPLIDMSLVIANNRKFVSALLFPDFDTVKKYKVKYKYQDMSDEEFLNTPEIQKLISDHIAEVNSHLNHWSHIQAFKFVPIVPTIETGELTPSMKLRRESVEKKYEDLIEAMYEKEGL